MVATGYIVDQVVLGLLYLGILVLFGLQLAVEIKVKKAEEIEKKRAYRIVYKTANVSGNKMRVLKVGKLQYFFHRIAFLVALLQCLRYIDPYGAYDIYDIRAISGFANNITALLLIAFAGAFYLPIELIYVVSFHRAPPPHYRLSFFASAGVVFLGANFTLISTSKASAAAFQIILAVVEAANVLLFDLGMWRLYKAFKVLKAKSFGPPSSSSNRPESPRSAAGSDSSASTASSASSTAPTSTGGDALGRALRHMLYFAGIANLVSIIAIAVELSAGLPLLGNKETVELRDRDKYGYSPTLIFVILQFLALCIMLWYSYLPISVLWKNGEEEEDSVENSMTAAALSHKRQPSSPRGRPLKSPVSSHALAPLGPEISEAPEEDDNVVINTSARNLLSDSNSSEAPAVVRTSSNDSMNSV